VSSLAGLSTLALVYGRRFQAARYTAAVAVAAIIAGWALARWPMILPSLTVYQAAAGHDTLVSVVVAVLAGGAILFPSLGLLFGLTLAGRFQSGEARQPQFAGRELRRAQPRLLTRSAIAALVAGVGLLNLADASWAHAVGVVCLLGFAVTAFLAIVFDGLGREPARPVGQEPTPETGQ
jgi:cytochrome d ubiquinol oxidase subunit II